MTPPRNRTDISDELRPEDRALLDLIARLAVEDAINARCCENSAGAVAPACAKGAAEAKVNDDDDA